MKNRHFGSYDRAMILPYLFPLIDFGTGSNITRLVPVPTLKGRGLAGRVLACEISKVVEDFAGSSTDSAVRVGDGSDDDKYFDTGLVLDETVDVGEVLHLEDDGFGVDIETGRSSVTVTFVANAGTPTGQADVTLIIAWW